MTEVAPNAAAPEPKLIKMELVRHYVPKHGIRIVGHQRPERKAKNAAGQEVVVQEAAFIEGEMKPAAYPGVGFPNKIWAGTVIEVPEDEAREMRAKKIAEAYL